MEQVIARMARDRMGSSGVGAAARRTSRVGRSSVPHALGALIRVHPASIGRSRAPSTEATYLAAVWACGEGALLSGRAAAHLWGLTRGQPPAPEVTAPTEREVEGVKTQRSPRICTQAKATHRGIPVTTVPQTPLDLAAGLSLDDLARACHEAGVRYRTTQSRSKRSRAQRARRQEAAEVLRGDAQVTAQPPRASVPAAPHPPRPPAPRDEPQHPRPPLHLRRRDGAPAPDARRTASAPAHWLVSRPLGWGMAGLGSTEGEQ